MLLIPCLQLLMCLLCFPCCALLAGSQVRAFCLKSRAALVCQFGRHVALELLALEHIDSPWQRSWAISVLHSSCCRPASGLHVYSSATSVPFSNVI